jgi:tetratricopeptide (TPR) repeat protein
MSGERVRLRERFRQHIEARAVTCRSFERDKKLQNELTIALMDLATRRRQEVAQTPHAGPGSEAAEFLAAPEYLMLRTQLEGREHELHEISAWAESDDPILVVEAFGGFGKSALSWQWWLRQKHRSDSEGLQRWRKGLWFGFYTEPSMHQFFRRLHAQLTGASQQAAASRPVDELAEESLEFMRRERHLIVMDGLERMLMIGSSLDANGEHPRSHPTSMPSDRFPHGAQARAARDLQDPLLARWLCRVANESRSRILITTRYHPKVLENVGRSPIRGVRHLDLKGLELAGARSYWQSLGFDPGEAAFERLHAAVHGHPLSLAVMGGTLRLSGATSLAVFFAEHPDFAHFDTQVSADGRDDVFRQALAALSPKASVLLETIAAYCYPAPLSDLVGLLCQLGETADRKFSLTEELERHQFGLEEIEDSALAFEDREGLIRTLLELEDRNLVARDGHNAVDLHPVIRSVVLDRAPRHELQKCDNRIVRYYTQAPRVSMPSRAEDLRHEVQAVFSATRAGLWQRATVLCAKSFTDLSLCDHLDRLNEQRDLAKIMDRFFCILRTDRGFSVKWIPEAPPPLQLPQNWGAGISFEDMVRSATGWDDLTLIRYIARTDFAMIAGAAHQAVGEYRLAHAMYELHNETCGQPLCRTMQSTCFRQAGRFGGAFKLLRDGLLELRRHARWRYDPYESSRVADCVFIESIERGQPKRARQAFALKWCIAGASKIESVTGNGTQSEWLRAANLQLARLARAEGDLARGLAIAAEVLEHAGHEGHRKDRVNALRELARASHAAGDYDRALSALDEIVREDRDGGQRGAALTARAERARARIGLGDFDLAREELAMIAQMADDAVETRAVVALYEAELFRRVRDPGGETAALIRGLDLYTLYPGTPMDIEDIRETVARLRELGAIEDRDIEKRQLAVLEPLPDWVRTGWGKWRIKPSDAEFELKTRWHL